MAFKAIYPAKRTSSKRRRTGSGKSRSRRRGGRGRSNRSRRNSRT